MREESNFCSPVEIKIKGNKFHKVECVSSVFSVRNFTKLQFRIRFVEGKLICHSCVAAQANHIRFSEKVFNLNFKWNSQTFLITCLLFLPWKWFRIFGKKGKKPKTPMNRDICHQSASRVMEIWILTKKGHRLLGAGKDWNFQIFARSVIGNMLWKRRFWVVFVEPFNLPIEISLTWSARKLLLRFNLLLKNGRALSVWGSVAQ
jgi:hypothetical protein